MNEHVTIFEVGPRDGLQNEGEHVPTTTKIALIDALSKTGLQKIEATSFVSPKWVPQLADATAVMAGINRRGGVTYAALTPNLTGLERALDADVDEVAIFGAASEAFSQKNINCSISESLNRFAPMMSVAASTNVPVRGYISCVTDCPYSGPVDPQTVADVAARLRDLGVYEISLGDTIGQATPETTTKMLQAVLKSAPAAMLAGHFHDTNNNALSNVGIGLQAGIRVFDSAVSGLGGCPYAPGAKGNVDTRALVNYLEEAGFHTGVDPDALTVAETIIAKAGLGRSM